MKKYLLTITITATAKKYYGKVMELLGKAMLKSLTLIFKDEVKRGDYRTSYFKDKVIIEALFTNKAKAQAQVKKLKEIQNEEGKLYAGFHKTRVDRIVSVDYSLKVK